jgi:TolA-binding protein
MMGRERRGPLTPRAAVAVAALLGSFATISLRGASASPDATLRAFSGVAVGVALREPAPRHQQAGGSAEDFARRQYETGLAFVRDGRYQEALKDFQAIVDNHPSSTFADQALLQIATYHFEQARDKAKASAALEQLLKAHPTGRAAPFAYLLSGRLAMASGAPSKEHVDAALASFERARRLFPVPEVTAAAGYYTGEALRESGRCADAMKAYQDVIVDYPRLVWSSRAELGMGRCLVTLDRAREAMPHLQRVRRAATGMPPREAETALRWNTILARLLVRAPADPAFAFGSRAPTTTLVRDVVAMAIAPKGDVVVLTENAFIVHAAQGGVIDSFTVNQARGLALDADGRPAVVTERGLMRARAQLVTLRAGGAAGSAAGATGGGASSMASGGAGGSSIATGRPLEELAAIGILSNGDIIAADRRTRAIHRFDADGQPRGAFAAINASRLVVNERDDIAVIEREGKSIALLDAAGTIVRRIPPRGEGYTLADPADVAIDAIGHIYVLDRDQATVFVFSKDGRVLATLRSPEPGESAFRQPSAIALDAAGRLYIHDERQRTVVIYQ